MQADLESLNEATGALFKIRQRPAPDAASGGCCAATRSTSCRSWSTCCAGQMSLVGPRPLPQRDFEQLEDWHKKRYLVLPGHHRACGRSPAARSSTSTTSCGSTSSTSSAGRSGSTSTILLKTIPAVLARRGAY